MTHIYADFLLETFVIMKNISDNKGLAMIDWTPFDISNNVLLFIVIHRLMLYLGKKIIE